MDFLESEHEFEGRLGFLGAGHVVDNLLSQFSAVALVLQVIESPKALLLQDLLML